MVVVGPARPVPPKTYMVLPSATAVALARGSGSGSASRDCHLVSAPEVSCAFRTVADSPSAVVPPNRYRPPLVDTTEAPLRGVGKVRSGAPLIHPPTPSR